MVGPPLRCSPEMPHQQLVRGPAIGHVGSGAVGDHHEASAAQDMEDDASADGFFLKIGKDLGWEGFVMYLKDEMHLKYE